METTWCLKFHAPLPHSALMRTLYLSHIKWGCPGKVRWCPLLLLATRDIKITHYTIIKKIICTS